MAKAKPRKGSSRRADIPPEILRDLNTGKIEAATLAEGLAIDFAILLKHADPSISAANLKTMKQAKTLGVTKRMAVAAELLHTQHGNQAFDMFRTHPSDTVRGWACFILGNHDSSPLKTKLRKIKLLANDPHFGVREWAWLALRDDIALDVPKSLSLLESWVTNKSEAIRRFAIEATRPRGVWCKHLNLLKDHPELGQPLLDVVMQDPARYVQDSCANWLNDASKTQPDWVRDYCEHWQAKHLEDPATRYITKRAQRSMKD